MALSDVIGYGTPGTYLPAGRKYLVHTRAGRPALWIYKKDCARIREGTRDQWWKITLSRYATYWDNCSCRIYCFSLGSINTENLLPWASELILYMVHIEGRNVQFLNHFKRHIRKIIHMYIMFIHRYFSSDNKRSTLRAHNICSIDKKQHMWLAQRLRFSDRQRPLKCGDYAHLKQRARPLAVLQDKYVGWT